MKPKQRPKPFWGVQPKQKGPRNATIFWFWGVQPKPRTKESPFVGGESNLKPVELVSLELELVSLGESRPNSGSDHPASLRTPKPETLRQVGNEKWNEAGGLPKGNHQLKRSLSDSSSHSLLSRSQEPQPTAATPSAARAEAQRQQPLPEATQEIDGLDAGETAKRPAF